MSGLSAREASPGWIAVDAGDAGKARWLSEQILAENVESFAQGASLFVPVGEHFTLKGEIKNVVTVVAKTTHYWADHIPNAMKSSLAWEAKLREIQRKLQSLFKL